MYVYDAQKQKEPTRPHRAEHAVHEVVDGPLQPRLFRVPPLAGLEELVVHRHGNGLAHLFVVYWRTIMIKMVRRTGLNFQTKKN